MGERRCVRKLSVGLMLGEELGWLLYWVRLGEIER
jgi:hypothetical protein